MIITGIGYDSHRLVSGKPLIIGGVKIPFEKGLFGHSDADVLVHAIIDAILGANGEKDIGSIFPNTDPSLKNISSLILLKKVNELIKCEIIYIDSVIIIEKPKLVLHIDEMKKNIASALGITKNRVSIKAKTNELMGFEGKGEGVSAHAVCSVDRDFTNE